MTYDCCLVGFIFSLEITRLKPSCGIFTIYEEDLSINHMGYMTLAVGCLFPLK